MKKNPVDFLIAKRRTNQIVISDLFIDKTLINIISIVKHKLSSSSMPKSTLPYRLNCEANALAFMNTNKFNQICE